MKKQIIKFIKKNKKLFLIAKALRFLQTSSFTKIDGSKKKYPKVIQLPITYKCNSKCVMCNIWKMDHSNEANIDEFGKFMKDDIFKDVIAVGINGGEPSLIPNLHKYAEKILELPSLKALNVISNGFNTDLFLKQVEKIYASCKKKDVSFHISISLDGVGKIHDSVRGIPNVFKKTVSTIDEIIKNQHKYCDSYDIGCTIVNQNIDYLIELDIYAKNKGYNMKYRLGIDNKRVESNKLKRQYSVIYDNPSKQTAKEFFHYKMYDVRTLQEKFKYFSIFYWLENKNKKRLLGCMWKEDGITLDARGNIYYCAVASKNLGTLRKNSGEDIFFNDKNIEHRKEIVQNHCDKCIHDYSGKVEFKNILIFLNYFIKNKIAMKIYEIKARFM